MIYTERGKSTGGRLLSIMGGFAILEMDTGAMDGWYTYRPDGESALKHWNEIRPSHPHALVQLVRGGENAGIPDERFLAHIEYSGRNAARTLAMNERLEVLIRHAVKTTGSFDPGTCLPHVEEELSIQEHREATEFLTWVSVRGKTFGRGNFIEVYQEFLKSRAGKDYRRSLEPEEKKS